MLFIRGVLTLYVLSCISAYKLTHGLSGNCGILFAKVLPVEHKRGAAFQNTVVNPGMSAVTRILSILGVVLPVVVCERAVLKLPVLLTLGFPAPYAFHAFLTLCGGFTFLFFLTLAGAHTAQHEISLPKQMWYNRLARLSTTSAMQQTVRWLYVLIHSWFRVGPCAVNKRADFVSNFNNIVSSAPTL